MDLCLTFQHITHLNLGLFGDDLSVFVDLGSGNYVYLAFAFFLD